MYKITRIKEINITFNHSNIDELVNDYINEELQENEILIDIKFFKKHYLASNLSFDDLYKVHLIIGQLV